MSIRACVVGAAFALLAAVPASARYGVGNGRPPSYFGFVFSLSAQTAGNPAVPWVGSTVHIFSGGPGNGSLQSAQGGEYAPALIPVAQADGSLALFGATVGGGANGTGIIFKLVP